MESPETEIHTKFIKIFLQVSGKYQQILNFL